MNRKVHVRVVGRIDGAMGAKVTIDRTAGLIGVRPLRRRRTYTLPLIDVARSIVGTVCRAEAGDKPRGRKVRRGML